MSKMFRNGENPKHLRQLSSISLGKEQTFEAKVHFSLNRLAVQEF